jgi:hypothetical protein
VKKPVPRPKPPTDRDVPSVTPKRPDPNKPQPVPPWRYAPPYFPFDPRNIDKPGSQVNVPDKSGHWAWKAVKTAAGVLGLTISAGFRALRTDLLEKAIFAAQVALETEGLEARAAIGLAGEMVARVILQDQLAAAAGRVFDLNSIRKNFPLIDLITPDEAPSIKNLGILTGRTYEEVRPNLLRAYKQLIGHDWEPGNRYRMLSNSAQALWDNRSRIPKSAMPDAIRRARSVADVEAALEKLATLRIPDDYVEPFRKDAVQYIADKMHVQLTIRGKTITGRKLTTKDALRIQSYIGKVQPIGLTSRDFRILFEAAQEIEGARKGGKK